MSGEYKFNPYYNNMIANNSSFLEKLNLLLEIDAIRYLSLDLFDTFFRRSCDEPAWVFEEAARRVMAQNIFLPMEPLDYRQTRIEAEKRARQLATTEDITFDLIFDCMPLSNLTKKALMQAELDVELEVLSVDPLIKIIINKAIEYNKKIIFISDIYLSAGQLSLFICNKYPDLNYEMLFASSDVGLTKSSGNLFRYAVSKLGVKPDQIVHIGDNYYSDVLSAHQNKFNSIHFDVPKYISDIAEKEKRYQVKLPSSVRHARKLAVLSAPSGLSEKEQFFFNYGAFILGPLLVSFSKWVIQRSIKLDVECILAIMREGGIISTCINNELEYDLSSKDKIVCFPCYASRKATFLPSLDSKNFGDLFSTVLTRKHYTVRDVFTEFEIEDHRLKDYLDTQLHMLTNVVVDGVDALTFIRKIIDESINKLQNIIRNKKRYLQSYIDNLTQGKNFATIDFGGGATIQHQLSKSLDKEAIINFLVYTTSRGYGKSSETRLNSFIPYEASTKKGINLLTRSPEIFEIVLVGKEQTTTSYTENEDGKVIPIIADGKYSSEHLSLIDAFENGIMVYQAWSQFLSIPAPEIKERIAYIKVMERLIECPDLLEVKYLGELVHEDNFGSNRSYQLINSDGVERLKKEGIDTVYRKFSRNTSYAFSWLSWPQGSITYCDKEFMKDYLHLQTAGDKHIDAVDTLGELLECNSIREVTVYGAGEFFLCLLPVINKLNIHIKNLVDKKAQFGKYTVAGYEVKSLSDCCFSDGDVVVIASAAYIDEIRSDIFISTTSKNITVLSL